MNEIILPVVMFTGVILLLVAIILVARSKLVSTGKIKININRKKDVLMDGTCKL